MDEHTPGDWIIDGQWTYQKSPAGANQLARVRVKTGDTFLGESLYKDIALVWTVDVDGTPVPEWEANARLIKAAPSPLLLKAARIALSALEEDVTPEDKREARKQIYGAITEATN